MPHLVGTYAEGAMKYECWLYALSYDTVCMYVCMCIGSSIGRDVSRQATGLLIGDTQAGLCNYMRLF